ncbi:hypothetical protein NDU88_006057 [Pleurodeles waltl]|uniref:Secreted protein n=1 Tax=Pleurodeles waltl TaxID=8319 RepID=A0AAV7VNJ2_PLEWA|nr:hypothetical protein NDU88_006057 [Pleurodeles waltl]
MCTPVPTSRFWVTILFLLWLFPLCPDLVYAWECSLLCLIDFKLCKADEYGGATPRSRVYLIRRAGLQLSAHDARLERRCCRLCSSGATPRCRINGSWRRPQREPGPRQSPAPRLTALLRRLRQIQHPGRVRVGPSTCDTPPPAQTLCSSRL